MTGSHRFYDETGGWTQTRDLSEGQTLRGLSGELTVVDIVHDPRPERVYSFTVETDHVYFVGDLTALTHNACPIGENEVRRYGDFRKFPGDDVEGHEILQSSVLIANGWGDSKAENPALALPEGRHGEVTNMQRDRVSCARILTPR